MGESREELTPEELKKKAYLIGLRLKNSGLDRETIYARLEKQGIPEDMVNEVIRNILIESKRDTIKQTEPIYNLALIRIGIGVGIALILYLAVDNVILLRTMRFGLFWIIAGGVITALWAIKRK